MKKIADCHNSQLQHIYRKLNHLRQLQEKVYGMLPEELQSVCHVANQEGYRLTLAVASSAWASRLRYILPNLQRALASENIRQIHFYVEPDFATLFPELVAKGISDKEENS